MAPGKSNGPMIAVIAAAIIALAGTAFTAFITVYITNQTTRSQERIAEDNRQESGREENMREENGNIIEVVKLAEDEKVHSGFCMLLKLNSIKTPAANEAVRNYIKETRPCGPLPPPKAQWITKSQVIPGCGQSGCYATTNVCGQVPPGNKPTGNVQNFVDSFSGAWGDWIGTVAVEPTMVCRQFGQHSHNVARTVSFDFEVVPIQ